MSHRLTTWWRALGVVLLSLATVTWPLAARADTTPDFIMVHQEALISMSAQGSSHFVTTLKLSARRANADVSIYPSLVTRSQLEAIVSGNGTSAPAIASTGVFALNCVHHGLTTFSIAIAIRTERPQTGPCGVTMPHLHVTCASNLCNGVYPLRYRVNVGGVEISKWSLLALQSTPIDNPIQVALIESLTSSALLHPRRSQLSLRTIGAYATLPITLGANYDTLSPLKLDTAQNGQWRGALNQAISSPVHQVINAPPSSIDFAGLAQNGFTTQVAQQFKLSASLFASLTGHYPIAPVLISGEQTPASLRALSAAGFSNVVFPENDLALPPSETLSWGAPFHVAGVKNLTAMSIDGPLSALVNDTAIGAGRRAALTLATLSFLHFEEPNAPSTRTVVINASLGSSSPQFLTDLLSGLQQDSLSRLSLLTPSFNPLLIGTNGAPRTRSLVRGPLGSPWSSRNVNSLVTLIGAVNSYTQGIASVDVATSLHVAVARSETFGNSSKRQNKINAATALLNAQLAEFSIDSSAITLAGQGTSLPITVISHAPYGVKAVVHLLTSRLIFPKGHAVAITLNSSTQSIRVATADPHGGSLTLQVVLTTPNGQVVLARNALQVRFAGTSVVGYLLTLASLLVLAWWWWRTNRQRTKGRHAR
ncbi:MAG: hypothetical protein ACYCPT_08580 [Acidimicrobiales bacterium]